MKKIDKPHDSGSASLCAASRNKKLRKTYPNLLRLGLRTERLAQHYDAAGGDPNIVRSNRISAKEKQAVLDLYESPPKGMGYIGELRDSLAGETCPMCGGYNPTELDHYLTKKKYPEYACVSYNLVPACSCNRMRGERLFDQVTHARVLHPYYDDCMVEPLIDLKFNPNDTPPLFTINYTISASNPNYNNVKFHVDNIVLRTNFLTHIGKRWGRLKAQPDAILPKHRDYRASRDEFHSYLIELSDGKSAETGPNSWAAIFFRSISRRSVSDWIFDNC
ncbi:hypothetical protein [Phaeobacter porticola]|uniref:Uncharacterized protein n=1 Tax=Phaeobacter porticola TaxID=1844006 RepID=A0A1L3I6V8_9RHOB|nr:hypothetical protein [Phaeobacter porticola]APG47889.1 hypothetical protein PhaeoP97_02506 [Phaeobacter porticola]